MPLDENGLIVVASDEQAAKAQVKAQVLQEELANRRKVLNADELAGLIAPRARLEQHFDGLNAYFFTIDGMLNGRKITGALFAGECMLVYALSERGAQEQANAGLRATIDLLHEEFDTRNQRLLADAGAIEAGLERDARGRRAAPSAPGQELQRLPKLKAMLASAIGGLPWKW